MAKRGHRPSQAPAGRPRFWGRHAVTAALANPERVVRKLWATREALASLDIPPVIPITYAEVTDLARLVPSDAPHQGLVAEVDPLEDIWLGDLLEQGADDQRPLLVLDQVTDPHNVGAILRSAAAFGVTTLMMTNRHSPEATGVLAKAASGALELVPFCLVRNLRQGLASLAERGFSRLGLDSDAENDITTVALKAPLVLVLGAEGKGLRAGTSEDCDILARIALPGKLTSLNVSNAAAVALFATHQRLALTA